VGRVDPIPPGQWPREMRPAFAPLQPPSPRDPSRPKGLNLLGLQAHHPPLTGAYNQLIGHLLYASTITDRQRELLVLRVAALRDSGYLWEQHAESAGDAGISHSEVARVRTGPAATGWPPLEAALLHAADDLVQHARIADSTWATLSSAFDTPQLMDLVFTVGAYDLLAMALRTFDVELDDDLRGGATPGAEPRAPRS
jgi:alkylhydroperoxidase family enzyme